MARIFQLARVAILIVLLHSAYSRSNYKVVNTVMNTTTVQLTLNYTGIDQYYLKPSSPHAKVLLFTFHTQTYADFYFKITDPTKPRFQIPTTGPFPSDPLANFSFPISISGVTFSYSQEVFDFQIRRKLNNQIIFSTYERQIIFSEYYLQIGTQLSSEYVYGLGERFSPNFKKAQGKWTIFNRDRGQVIDKGLGLQTYGYFPAYLLRQKDNFFHIAHLRNSNAMDVIMKQQLGRYFFSNKIIGGVIDFRFFLGEQSIEIGEQSIETTIQRFHQYIGRAQIPPFWAFGFHQSRWGYENSSVLKEVIDLYQMLELPLDTIWSDIDYMINYEVFTVDQTRFPLSEMKSITDRINYVPIIDAGIKTSGIIYEEGLKRDIFIKDADGKQPFKGKVRPGETAFVDWFHPNATSYWSDMLQTLYQKIKFSGIWLDMNEVTSFCDGPCTTPTTPSRMDYSNDLPYNPGFDGIQSDTISLNSTHYGGLTQANVHVFHGFLQTYGTYEYLKSKGKKPFILTRSTTFGSSKYGIHWSGDNQASWDFLKGSIVDNFNIGLSGTQMMGADICGFASNTTTELCARWFQLGSLYPFARNHNDRKSQSQEAYALGIQVYTAAAVNLKFRYALLKHYYTLFVNKRGVGTIFRPLFFAFPLDPNNYINEIADTQFMIGDDLMAAPILEKGQTSRKVYFPQVQWYDLSTGQAYKPGTEILITDVQITDLVPLFLREGGGFLMQLVQKATRTYHLDNKFALYAGMRLDPPRSTPTQQVYEAVTTTLSIKDYNDDIKVDICSRQGCNYIFNMLLIVEESSITLEIDISYLGESGLNEEVILQFFGIYYDGKFGSSFPLNPFVITGPRRIVVPIKEIIKQNMPKFWPKPDKKIRSQ